MKVNEELVKFIDNATPEELLRRWRFSENDPIFQGELGEKYARTIRKVRTEMGDEAWAKLSKKVGWEI